MLNRKVNKRDKQRKRFRKYFYILVQRFGSFCCHLGFLALLSLRSSRFLAVRDFWLPEVFVGFRDFWLHGVFGRFLAIPYQIGRPLLMKVVSLPT